ncbi:MAG: hypothetical protein IT567_05000 [Alphaproteobacteria bacterium]|nr:hypothetical protein [Alphaproteobacteria bacterium]
MTEDLIGYAELIDNAMRGVVKETLRIISAEGLPGDHHCYVTFRTDFPGVSISDTLRKQYPEEMTIVIQHQYWDLKVMEDSFTVTLSFNRQREPLIIPFAALMAFADPSIKFGLQFQRDYHYDDEEEASFLSEPVEIEGGAVKHRSAEVISLDTFRAKKSNDEEGDADTNPKKDK